MKFHNFIKARVNNGFQKYQDEKPSLNLMFKTYEKDYLKLVRAKNLYVHIPIFIIVVLHLKNF